MKERASYLIPYLFDQPNFLKPPFQYWATLLGWKAFGFGLLGALVPSLFALLGCAYWVRRLIRSESYLPALFFSGTVGTLTYGTTAQMEIWIVLFYLAAWTLWLEKRLFLNFLVLGIMSWIKGPLYPALWVLSLFLYEKLNKNEKSLFQPKIIGMLLGSALLGLLWYMLAAFSHRSEIFAVFFKKENFGKMQTAQGSMLGLWGSFVFSLMPLLLWLFMSLFDHEWRRKINEKKKLFFAFALIPALFFTFFPYRVNTYLFLLTPLAVWCMQTGKLNISKKVKNIFVSASFVFALLMSFISIRLWIGGWIGFEIAIPTIFILMAWSYSHFKLSAVSVGVTSLLLVNLVRLGAIQVGEWDVSGLRHFQKTHVGQPLFYYFDHEDIWHEYGLVSTALSYDFQHLHDANELQKRLEAGGAVILSDEMNPLAVKLQCVDWTRLKRRMKFPIQKLIRSGLTIQDPELHRTYRICMKSHS